MRFLLDTDAVSEPRRPAPDQGYMDWLSARRPDELAISVLTIGELTLGVGRLARGRRRAELAAWLSAGLADFADRVLLVDVAVASAWADVNNRHRRAARRIGVIDELIAATGIARGLTVVTRNTVDFEASGCGLLKPWSG